MKFVKLTPIELLDMRRSRTHRGKDLIHRVTSDYMTKIVEEKCELKDIKLVVGHLDLFRLSILNRSQLGDLRRCVDLMVIPRYDEMIKDLGVHHRRIVHILLTQKLWQ
jgi:hypothetical protein